MLNRPLKTLELTLPCAISNRKKWKVASIAWSYHFIVSYFITNQLSQNIKFFITKKSIELERNTFIILITCARGEAAYSW